MEENIKKKKKGFTLIELLAVIVILAVIILLAVNVIIPLINKSRKKALIDEAHVYMNAALNYRAIDGDSNSTSPSCITITELNHEYVKKSSDKYKGVVKINYVNGELIPTINLTDEKYYIVGSNNISTSSVVTEEPENFAITCEQQNTLTEGDVFTIGTDKFVYVGQDSNNIKLLSVYNIDSTSRQSETLYYTRFAESYYWDANYVDYKAMGDTSYRYVYRTVNGVDGDNSIKDIVNAYKTYLNGLGIVTVDDARLMSYEEVSDIGCTETASSCPTYLAGQNFWLGSIYLGSEVWTINTTNYNIVDNRFNRYVTTLSIRPIVLVPKNITYSGSGTDLDPYVITG